MDKEHRTTKSEPSHVVTSFRDALTANSVRHIANISIHDKNHHRRRDTQIRRRKIDATQTYETHHNAESRKCSQPSQTIIYMTTTKGFFK